ncbi:MAG TPA: hypothetical protein VFY04_09565 [Solirubrobacterales bacterium]|nr:hypothetical protein [Solirubrobacterales bacterium]
MKADYESRADTIQITLEDGGPLSGGSDVIEGGRVIISFCENRPALIDVIGTDNGFEDSLRVAAERNRLDAEALIAISRAALAAPDRPVRLDVGARLAA